MPRPFARLAALCLCLVAAACSKPAAPPEPSPSAAPDSSQGAAAAGGEASADAAAELAALPAPYNTGNVDNGRAKFALCMACHSLGAGAPAMTGPNLHGVFGRKAGSSPGFMYSDAMKAQTFSWDAARLDTWLANPLKDIPGAKMTFAGLPNAQDRIDVIAYLKVATTVGP
jgi:cytochrome c